MELLATDTTIKDVIATLKPGHSFTYYVGSLMRDRRKGGTPQEMLALNRAAVAAYAAYENGDVILTQRKLSPTKYEYILTKTTPPPPKKHKAHKAQPAGGDAQHQEWLRDIDKSLERANAEPVS